MPGRSGVWLRADDRGPERKIAALGIRVSRGITMHGFAINCDVDLGWYDRFVPCGIADAGVTSAERASSAGPVARRRGGSRSSSGTCASCWPGRPTTATPDYEPRPSRAAARGSSC